jgi:uncharacterized membrane protein YebE (DUF533 family)
MFDFESYLKMNQFDIAQYFRGLIAIAQLDGKMCENEEMFLNEQAELFSFDISELLAQPVSAGEISLADMEPITKKLIIRDFIGLAYCDGDYDKRERNRVNEIAQEAGIAQSEVDAIEKWLCEYWSLMESAEKLFL